MVVLKVLIGFVAGFVTAALISHYGEKRVSKITEDAFDPDKIIQEAKREMDRPIVPTWKPKQYYDNGRIVRAGGMSHEDDARLESGEILTLVDPNTLRPISKVLKDTYGNIRERAFDDEDMQQLEDPYRIDIDALIFTESGGDPDAIGDGGQSNGICQLSKAAWDDALLFAGIGADEMDYDDYVFNEKANRAIANIYVNKVIPQRYFKSYKLPDGVSERLAAYKCGPASFRNWFTTAWEVGKHWNEVVPAKVVRDINKYQKFLRKKQETLLVRDDSQI